MKVRFIWLTIALLVACPGAAQAKYRLEQTQTVPIDRVLNNLQQRLTRNSNDVQTLYDLGRVHSMAFATNLTMVEVSTNDHRPVFAAPWTDIGVPKQVAHPLNPQAQAVATQHLTKAIDYYRRAAALLPKGTNASVDQWLVLPIHLGLAWCLDEAGRRQDAINAYREALQLARQQQGGRVGRGPISYGEEIIGYLLKLLDPVKDAKEIAQLEQDRKTLQNMPRAISPILISLEPDTSLEELVNPDANVAFDLDGSGDAGRRWGWITPKAAWLVFDHDGSGRITSGLQMFGIVTFWVFWRDGYDALSALDDDGDGTLKGSELRGLSLWRDLNGNGISEPGEVRPVTDWGVLAIECSSQLHPSGIPFHPRGVVLRDGSTRPTFDWIVPSPAVENPSR